MRAAFLALALLAVVVPAAAQGPCVTRLEPAHGSDEVDPGTSRLLVTFDQDMDTKVGWSVCGGGESFPEVASVGWLDARTLQLQVRLQPGRSYRMELNCAGSSQRLANPAGTKVAPTPWEFATAGDEISPFTAEEQRTRNAASLAEVEAAIDRFYSYRDRVVGDWDARFDARRETLLAATTDRQFATELKDLLAAAEDPHLWVGKDGIRDPTSRSDRHRNVDVSLLPERVEGFEKWNEVVWTGRFERDGGDIGYLALTTLDGGRTREVREGLEALEELSDCAGLILDLRFNGGGAELLAMQFAAWFATEPSVYARQITRDPETGAWDRQGERRLIVNDAPKRFDRPVAALIGKGVVSSAEGFALMLRQCPNVTLIGVSTFGSSANPQPHLLTNGYEVWLPSWRALDAEGKMIEGVGIAPDVLVETTAGDFADGDPILARALEHLQR